jgi:hypothetical protein
MRSVGIVKAAQFSGAPVPELPDDIARAARWRAAR